MHPAGGRLENLPHGQRLWLVAATLGALLEAHEHDDFLQSGLASAVERSCCALRQERLVMKQPT